MADKKRKRWAKKDPANVRGRSVMRYRAYPSDEQRMKARRIDGCCRVVKNLAKEQRDFAKRIAGTKPGIVSQCKDVQELTTQRSPLGSQRPQPRSSSRP